MKKVIAVAVLSAIVATPAVAASNFYIGAKAGSTKHHIDQSGYTETTGAFSIFGGYTFNPNFSVEIEAVGLGSLVSSTVSVGAASLSAVGSLPLSDQASVFGKIGVASTHEEIKSSGKAADRSGITIGLGGQYDVTPAVGIRLGWDRYTYGGSNGFYDGTANMYSIGALLRF